MGTFSQKIQCHETPFTIAPPTSGPIAIASPPMPPQMPSARPRRFRGTAAERMVSVSGVTIARADALQRTRDVELVRRSSRVPPRRTRR